MNDLAWRLTNTGDWRMSHQWSSNVITWMRVLVAVDTVGWARYFPEG
jgi:hypothetical protein